MKVANVKPGGSIYSVSGSSPRPRSGSNGPERSTDHVEFSQASHLSLPQMLEITASDSPRRSSFLTALSESLHAGLRTSDPDIMASSALRRGFDSIGSTND